MAVCATQMPFGKKKKLSMPRAQKTKVSARAETRLSNDETGVTGSEDACRAAPTLAASTCMDAPVVAASPGAVKRKQATEECNELFAEFEAWETLDGEAEVELALAKRLYDAKVRRIDKAQAGKRHGSPFLELERIYKTELELTLAKLKRSEVEAYTSNSESNFLGHQCRVLRLENAKLRRLLRSHGHDRLCI